MTQKFIVRNLFLIIIIFLVGCNSNDLTSLEDSNAHPWQKYMNEEEFNQLNEGMTYEEVVEIAKGAGEQIEDSKGVYRWLDEKLVTQAYDIEFKENKLVAKKIIEIRGSSTRDLPEKEPAQDPNAENDSTVD